MLDPKEDVIKFELTRLGKESFANGTFKPVAYSFGDSGVVYDIVAASGSEGQKDSGNRIYNETPMLEGLWINHQAVENAFTKEDARSKERANIHRLGSMNSKQNLAPKWRMNFIKGKMDTVTRIDPNWLEVTGTIRYKIEETNKPVTSAGPMDSFSFTIGDTENTLDLGDGFYASIKDDYIIIKLEEENVEFTKDNFTIRVRDEDSQKYLRFSDESEMFGEIDKDSVEHSVFLLFDKNIPEEIMCKYLPGDRKKDFFDDTTFSCPDNIVEDETDWIAVYERQLKTFKGVC